MAVVVGTGRSGTGRATVRAVCVRRVRTRGVGAANRRRNGGAWYSRSRAMDEWSKGSRRLEGLVEVLEAVRGLGHGRYACILDSGGLVAEAPEPDDGRLFALRQLLQERRQALLAIPGALEEETDSEDPFADWSQDQFLLAVLNRRAALVVACPDAEALKDAASDLLRVWVDRMLRYDERYRFDPAGRGLFFGRPRLDLVVVGSASAPTD